MRSKYHQRLLIEEDRFFSWVEKSAACWLWQGALDRDGYGRFRLGKPTFQTIRAHHYLYGEIPVGLQLDHLCRVRHCVRPEHLEAVTTRLNLRRSPITVASIRARQTHCKHGHPFEGRNLYLDKDGCRRCRACDSEKGKRSNEKRWKGLWRVKNGKKVFQEVLMPTLDTGAGG